MDQTIPIIFISIIILSSTYFFWKRKSKPKDVSLKTENKTSDTKKLRTLEEALDATKKNFWSKLQSAFASSAQEIPWDSIEETLYTSDLGPTTVQRLLANLEEKLSPPIHFETLRTALKQEMLDILMSANSDELQLSKQLQMTSGQITDDPTKIWMVVGVNGVGKTTSIGKLASLAASQNKKVLIAAGDTFRAAAGEQLKVWSERAKVEIYAPETQAKPSGVAFDACQKGLKEKFNLVIIDTAGRLHTQMNLMDELKKIKRVVQNIEATAPHEVLLVLDASSGQNALVQAKQFHEAVGVTGVILTKLDGTAKGGVAVGLAGELHLPIKAIGVGEKLEDLRSFSPQEFVDSII